MAKSEYVLRLDEVQKALSGHLKQLGFRRAGRTFNRSSETGVVQVINLQTGPFEVGTPLPPEAAHLRPDLYGQFAINLGVHVSEIYNFVYFPKTFKMVQEYNCTIRCRLNEISFSDGHWWSLQTPVGELADEILRLLSKAGIPFLERYATRELIEANWIADNDSRSRFSNTARVDVAIMLASKGNLAKAEELFASHIALTRAEMEKGRTGHPGHIAYVKSLAERLGIKLPD